MIRVFFSIVFVTTCFICPGDSLILDISDSSENLVVGQTLKRPTVTNDSPGEQKYDTKEEDLSHKSRIRSDKDASDKFISSSNAADQSNLSFNSSFSVFYWLN